MESDPCRQREIVGIRQTLPIRHKHHRELHVRAQCVDQSRRFRRPLHVHPLKRDAVAGQEVLHLMAASRPQHSGHPDPLIRERRRGLPLLQQIVEQRIEHLLGRFPRLHQVVVEPHRVDRGNGRVGVCIGSEEHLLGIGIQLDRLLEKLGAGHGRHALVNQEERHQGVPALQLGEGLERVCSRCRRQHPVVLLIASTYITADRGRHRRFIVDTDDHRFRHCTTSAIEPLSQ
jgi:hypothetical protein